MPRELLEGLLPDALLESYRFWKTGPRMLRGYPRPGAADLESSIRAVLVDDKGAAASGAMALVYKDFCPATYEPPPNEDRGQDGRGDGVAAVTSANHQEDVDDFDYDDADRSLLLLNPMRAAPGSDLATIAAVFARVESLSHVLVWCVKSCCACVWFSRAAQ